MNGIQEVREEYKQAARQFIRHVNTKECNRSNIEYEGRMSGLEIALRCLGVNSDELREMYKTCKEEVEHDRIHQAATDAANQIEREKEQEQEELDAMERPTAQAQVEEDIYECEHCNAEFKESEILYRDYGGEIGAIAFCPRCKEETKLICVTEVGQ